MQGWRVILLVNGGIFLFMAVSTWGLAGFTSSCDESPEADCDPSAGVAGTMRSIALGLLLVGVVLLALGLLLRRDRTRTQP